MKVCNWVMLGILLLSPGTLSASEETSEYLKFRWEWLHAVSISIAILALTWAILTSSRMRRMNLLLNKPISHRPVQPDVSALIDEAIQHPTFRRNVDERIRRLIEPMIPHRSTQPVPQCIVPQASMHFEEDQTDKLASILLRELIEAAERSDPECTRIQLNISTVPELQLHGDISTVHRAVERLNYRFSRETGLAGYPLTTVRHRRSLTGEPNIILESLREYLEQVKLENPNSSN